MNKTMKWGAFLLAALLGLLLSGWAFYLEPSSLGVRQYVIQVPEWSAANPALRIAVLGDLHVGSPFNDLVKLREIVELTNLQQPDLVLLAGDYVIQGVLGGTRVDPREIASVLGKLQSPAGVYAVLGNHDYWWGVEEVAESLREAGITVLEDEAVHLRQEGLDFWLVGISDFWEGEHNISRALNLVPAGKVVIALTHNPDIFPEIPDRVALTVAAHTHGGQVSLPLIGPPIVPSVYGQRFAAGVVEEDGRHLFVSPGLGTSMLPVRFRVPPEISIVEVE